MSLTGKSALAACALAIFIAGVAVGRYRLIPLHVLRTAFVAPAVTQTALPENPYQALQAPLFEDFPAGNIVMLGDSITGLAPWGDLFPSVRISNRAIFRDTTKNVLARLNPIVRDRPHKIFIMLGVNDLTLGETVADTFGTYSSIIDKLSSAKIYVQSTLAVDESLGLNPKISELNSLLSAHCGRTALCTYIDLNNGMPPDARLSKTHLSPSGYRHWRDKIAQLVQ